MRPSGLPDQARDGARKRRLGVVAAAVVFAVAALALVAVSLWERAVVRRPEPSAAALTLTPASFSALDGWRDDDHAPALAAFLRSCERLARLPADRAVGREPWAGRVSDWRPLCEEAGRTPAAADAARGFFERGFLPYRVAERGGDGEGLFTGYYEPLLEGSRQPDARFNVPLHRLPPDLVVAELGEFDPGLAGRRATGRVSGGKLVPYHTRAEIVRGALAGRGLELLWVDDAVAAFNLQIQGSGQVRLRDGSIVRVGYAGQNGRPYRAIGRDLVEMGVLPKGGVSMQAIRDWLKAHPDKAVEVMDRNPSYVFFRELPRQQAEAPGPLGAQEAALTPGRSLAVDRRFVPLGAPLWLEAKAPAPAGGERPLRRLVVAQDTGGAIKGPVRGDLFWGSGPEAEFAAGHMQSRGRYYILLPRALAPTS